MKSSFWVLATSALWCGLSRSHVVPGLGIEKRLDRREPESFHVEKPKYVYRGEVERTPEQITKEGGFFARGTQALMTGPLSDDALQKGSSLYYHAMGVGLDHSRYVSTTTDPAVSLFFAANSNSKSYVYKIHADKKMVDVNRSLGKYSPFPSQFEHAVIAYIPIEQVEGWWEIEHKHIATEEAYDETQQKLRKGEFDTFTENPKYDKTSFKSQRGYGSAPQLAGFLEGTDGFRDQDWEKYKTIKTSASFDKVLNEACSSKAGCYLERITPKTSAAGPKAPPNRVRPKVKGGFRAYGKVGTLLAFQIVSPYLQQVLHRLREWDHPIGKAVKWADDKINGFQESIGGPRREDISGNDNQAKFINAVKGFFWILMGDKRHEVDPEFLPIGKQNKEKPDPDHQSDADRVEMVNQVLKACDNADEEPPKNEDLKGSLSSACYDLREGVLKTEDPTEQEAQIHNSVCRNCGLEWKQESSECWENGKAIVWPQVPLPEIASCRDEHDNCAGGQTPAEFQIGEFTCQICGTSWDPAQGRCLDAAGSLLWPLEACRWQDGKVECQKGGDKMMKI